MITASHNPPSRQRLQVLRRQRRPGDPARRRGDHRAASRPPRSATIPENDFQAAVADGSIVLVGPEVDDDYLTSVVAESVSHARDISIVYTPMHGVGETSVAAALGASRVSSSQRPGRRSARRTATSRTSPAMSRTPRSPRRSRPPSHEAEPPGPTSCSRATRTPTASACAVPVTGDPKGEWTTLDGNQIGALLAAFVLKQTEALGKLRHDHYIVTTLVTSQMARALAAA